MGLLISQGKQKIIDNSIVVAENATCKIEAVKIHPSLLGAILVSFRILDGPAKGRLVNDTVNYEASSPMVWKYQALRKAVGKEYKVTEPEKIDIEALLLNKGLICDFSKRVDKDGKEWQNVKYKSLPKGTASTSDSDDEESAKPTSSDEWGDEVGDDELPF